MPQYVDKEFIRTKILKQGCSFLFRKNLAHVS